MKDAAANSDNCPELVPAPQAHQLNAARETPDSGNYHDREKQEMKYACNIRGRKLAREPKGPAAGQHTIRRYGRFWAVHDPAGDLVCLAVYKRGATEVVRRLSAS